MFDLLFFFFKCSPVLHILSVILCCCFISPTCLLSVLSDLYCTLEVDSFGYFVSKAKTRVFRDTTEPQWNEVSRKDIFFSFLMFLTVLFSSSLFSLFTSVSLHRSLRLSWRAPSTFGSCATRSVTTKACWTKTTMRLWTRLWAKGKSR